MFGWLRDRLRRWLAADDDPTDYWIDVREPDGVVTYQAYDAVGPNLLCTSQTGGMRVVMIGQAADPAKFTRVWKRLAKGEDLYWEDGTPFRPDV